MSILPKQVQQLASISTPSAQLSSSQSFFYNNFIIGTPFDDILKTTSKNDIVVALAGDDTIKGSSGDDFIFGDTGTDVVDYSHLKQAITLEAGGIVRKGSLGTDQILEVEEIIGAKGKANVIDASTGTSGTTSLFVNLLSQSLTINNIPVPGMSSLNFTVKNFRNVIGTSRNDFIIGDNFNNKIEAGAGNDTVLGLGGNDTFIGGAGFDFYDGGTGFDIADYSNLGQAITIESAGRVDKGSAGNDRLVNIERIVGAFGKANVIDASTGTSTTTSLDVNLAAQKLVINNVPGVGSLKFQVQNFRNVIGTSRNDSIIGDNFNNVIEGGAGNDTLAGGSKGFGFISKFTDGNDIINAGSGNDLVRGGTGFDALDGGKGFDTVDYSHVGQAITLESAGRVDKGFAGNDEIVGFERIIGAKGQANVIDASTGTSSTTRLDVNLAAQKLVINNVPGVGSLKFQVQNFRNVIGTSRNDSIIGDNFNNVLEGGAGNDRISGNGGKDTLIGVDTDSFNAGFKEVDILSGGTGADKFVVADKNDTYYTGGGGFFGLNDFAFLSDFETGQDKIQLSKSDSYIFGKNFIAVRNFFKPFPILLDSSDASTDGITGFKADTFAPSIEGSTAVDFSMADDAVNDIISGRGSAFETLSFGAEATVPESSLKSSSLIAPIPFGFDIVAIVANNYDSNSDIHFV